MAVYNSYRRMAPPLPDPDKLPFPGNLVRRCTDCPLHATCKAPVPGKGPTPADIMLVGQNPGFNEGEWGEPFVGQAGQYLNSLLFHCGVSRDSIYITNMVKCLTPNNRELKPDEIRACAHWLDMEIGVVNPRIIVAMGKPAIDRFLGKETDSVEKVHGKPVIISGRIILPAYHPAAALHNTTLLRQVGDDFNVLRGLARGESPEAYIAQDEYPNPEYIVVDTPEKHQQMLDEIRDVGECAIDEENVNHNQDLWSVQVSAVPGKAWFVPMPKGYQGTIDTTSWGAHVIVHYYLNDSKWIKIRDDDFTDTMTMAYLCVARETPILKADLTWYRADQAKIGDVLVGFDEDIPRENGKAIPNHNNGYVRRHLRKSVVENVHIHKAECFDVALSDGRHEICTGDHRWQVYSVGHHALKWLTVKEIASRMGKVEVIGGKVCNPSKYVIRSLVPQPWDVLDTHDTGWLAGIIDGEGNMDPNAASGGVALSISQNPGPVHDKIERALRQFGFDPSNNLYNDSSKEEIKNNTYTLLISGMANVMRLLGQVRPTRMDKDFWVGKAFPQDQRSPTIESITPVGIRDVVAITTSTGTYIADGLASHNCGLPQGLKDLAYRLCGVRMQTYKETVRLGQRKLSEAYLIKASKRNWKDPPPIFETKWNNKQGCIVTRQKKPWHISRKIQSILDKMGKDPEYDPYDAWCKDIDPLERAEVEEALGLMPESSLADIKFEDAVDYACRDAMMTLRVKHKMQGMMADLGLDFISGVDHGILPMVQDMMKNGMAIDLEHYKRLSEDYDIRLRVKAAELAGVVGHAFNPGSSLQVAAVMYSELGFKPTKYTQTKEICTDDQELKKIKDSETGKIHPVSQKIIQYRGLMKLKTTYADNMVKSARPDETGVMRMHTKLNTTRVETGRLSSSKNPDTGEGTNLQNIPTRNKESKKIKNGFIAPDGKVMAEGDYGQIEMVTLADMSGCKRLIELFNRGGDPHTEMAAKIFDVPLSEAEKSKYRYPVKRLNFGIAYLIGAQGLSNQIQEYIADLEMEGEPVEIEAWPESTCDKFIQEWYKLNPEVKDMQMEFAAMARRYGYVKDKFGRIRYIPEVACPIKSIQEAGIRQAANMPITATAQGIIKLAMGQLWRELPKTEWAKHVKFLMQIHDSLIDEITDDEKIYKPYLAWKGKIMTSVVQLKVPIKVDFKVGKRWGDLQKCKV